MEEKLKYEIKINVYESGSSRIEPVKNVNIGAIKEVLQRHIVAIERAIIKGEVLEMLKAEQFFQKNLPSLDQIMKTKQ